MKTPEALLQEAAERLAKAASVEDVQVAHKQLRAAIRTKRRDQAKGVLAQTYTALMDVWDDQKEQGVSLEERVEGLEKSLRAAWPQGREWKYLCKECDDTGWVFHVCTHLTPCGRPFKLPGAALDDYTGRGRCTPGHSYCVACVRCEKGRTFGANLQKSKWRSSADLAAVGKSKTKAFTRFGS